MGVIKIKSSEAYQNAIKGEGISAIEFCFDGFSQSDKFKALKFYRVDICESQDVAMDSKVKLAPTYHFYQNGNKIGEYVGSSYPALEVLYRSFGSAANYVHDTCVHASQTYYSHLSSAELPAFKLPPGDREGVTFNQFSASSPAPPIASLEKLNVVGVGVGTSAVLGLTAAISGSAVVWRLRTLKGSIADFIPSLGGSDLAGRRPATSTAQAKKGEQGEGEEKKYAYHSSGNGST
ncbi:hypothetical protein P7C70_g7128, partial [Phenoliferia sp. Uapishka_3]